VSDHVGIQLCNGPAFSRRDSSRARTCVSSHRCTGLSFNCGTLRRTQCFRSVPVYQPCPLVVGHDDPLPLKKLHAVSFHATGCVHRRSRSQVRPQWH
jgi:hypothetical protein